MPDSTTAMITASSPNADPPRQVGRDEAAEQWPDGGGNGRGGADQGIDLLLGGPSKLPWMSDCMAGSSSEAPSPPMIAQKMIIAVRALREGHGDRADRVAAQPEHVGALAADEIADLAADQDERRRDQRFERDGRLDAAHCRVEVVDHCRDRHVHDRRVDDEHEHRHRQQEREPSVERWLRAGCVGVRRVFHGIPTYPLAGRPTCSCPRVWRTHSTFNSKIVEL